MIINFVTSLILIAAGICDAKRRRIPNRLLLIMLVFGIINIISTGDDILGKILGFFFPSSILLVARILGTSIGAGDIKLFSCLGLICGIQINLFVFFASSVLSLLYFAMKKIFFKKQPDSSLAFAPFITISYIFSVLYTISIR